jgi:hypothetical protein
MAKDKTFNLRLDDADRVRLDRVAQHFACSAAVAIRLLIKMKSDEIEAMPTQAEHQKREEDRKERDRSVMLSTVKAASTVKEIGECPRCKRPIESRGIVKFSGSVFECGLCACVDAVWQRDFLDDGEPPWTPAGERVRSSVSSEK